jgi:thiamine biosynthesis lipoprotein ApbE
MVIAVERWEALGTSVHLLVTHEPSLELASAAVRSVLEQVDTTYSRFREDSEVSRLSANPGVSTYVSPLLAEAIDVALRAARLTDGAVDPTVGRAMRLVGYDDDFPRLALGVDRPLVLREEAIPGWRAVRFDRRTQTVVLPRGVELDLGSTGKALAADLAARAVQLVVPLGGTLVALGGDIATAGDPPPDGWPVLTAEDSATPPDSPGEVIALHRGAIATSSTTVRRWTRDGITLHHLIEPSTGLPVHGPWRTATVLAGSCVEANTASTAAIVRGASAVEWLEASGLAARLVSEAGAVHRTHAWPQPLESAA